MSSQSEEKSELSLWSCAVEETGAHTGAQKLQLLPLPDNVRGCRAFSPELQSDEKSELSSWSCAVEETGAHTGAQKSKLSPLPDNV